MHSGALSVALVLHLGESVAALVDCLLMLLSKVNLLRDTCFQILLFALKILVVSGDASNLTTVLDYALVSCGDFLLD